MSTKLIYEAGEREHASLGALIAYAATLAFEEQKTVYVRVKGEVKALYRAEWVGDAVTVVEVI